MRKSDLRRVILHQLDIDGKIRHSLKLLRGERKIGGKYESLTGFSLYGTTRRTSLKKPKGIED